MRVRSPKWDTVDLPGAVFRRLVRPLHDYTHGAAEAPLAPGGRGVGGEGAEECPF
jgi:hypothetical protein